MNKILLAFVLMGTAQGATLGSAYLRTRGTGYCRVTGVSTANPAIVTVSDMTRCGLANGDKVIIADVAGATGINIHLEDASDTNGICRTVASLSGNTFAVKACDGTTNVSGAVHASCSGGQATHQGNCAYIAGGRVGKATLQTLTDHPRIWLDGSAGSRTAQAVLTTGTGKATASNPFYGRVLSNRTIWNNNYASQWGYNWYQTQALNHYPLASAIHYYVTGDTTSRDAAKFLIQEPEQIGLAGCDESAIHGSCGWNGQNLGVYAMDQISSSMMHYSLIRGALSGGEISNFMDFLLSDNSWAQNGINYTANYNLVKKGRKSVSGNLTLTAGSTAAVGVSTAFTTELAVGDILLIPGLGACGDSYQILVKVATITDNTHLAMSSPAWASCPSGSAPYEAYQPWASGAFGFSWANRHYEFNVLVGAGEDFGGGTRGSAHYSAGVSGVYSNITTNHTWSRGAAHVPMGLATCGDDPRGCLLLSLGDEWMYDRALPWALQKWTGFSGSSLQYHVSAITNRLVEWAAWIQYSTVNQVSSLPADYLSYVSKWFRSSLIPGAAFFPFVEEDYVAVEAGTTFFMSLATMGMQPSATESQYLQHDVINKYWYADGTHALDSTAAPADNATLAWLTYEPSVTATQDTNSSRFFVETQAALCNSIFGSAITTVYPTCSSEDKSRMAFSFSSVPATNNFTMTMLGVDLHGITNDDHQALYPQGGNLAIIRNRHWLLGRDADRRLGTTPAHRASIQVGAESNWKDRTGTTTYVGLDLPVPWYGGNSSYFFTRHTITAQYEAAANVTAMERQTFHLKAAGQDYIVDHVAGTLGSSGTVKSLVQLQLESGYSASFSSSNKNSSLSFSSSPNACLSSQAIAMNGTSITAATEDGNDAHLGYTGGNGYTGRWFVSYTGTGPDFVIVHMPKASASCTAPTYTTSTAGSFRTLIIADGSNPKALAFTALGATASSLSGLTLAATSQLTVTGLAADTYKVQSAGSDVSGCTALVVDSTSHALNCDSVPAGAITIAAAGGGGGSPDIDQTSLPGGTVGVSYSQTLTATGGAGSNVWDVSAGTICAGLSLSSGGAITGTPTTAQTCSFTARVTDSAMATDTQALSILIGAAPGAGTGARLGGRLVGGARLQ